MRLSEGDTTPVGVVDSIYQYDGTENILIHTDNGQFTSEQVFKAFKEANE